MQEITEMIQHMYQRECKKCKNEAEKLDTSNKNSSSWVFSWGRIEILREIADKLNISL